MIAGNVAIGLQQSQPASAVLRNVAFAQILSMFVFHFLCGPADATATHCLLLQ